MNFPLIVRESEYENSNEQFFTKKFHFSSNTLLQKILYEKDSIGKNDLVISSKKCLPYKDFKIVKQSDLGKGLKYVGSSKIPKYTVLMMGYGLFVKDVVLPKHENTAMEITKGKKIWYILNDYLVSKISYANHSCNPNCELYNAWYKLTDLEYYKLDHPMYIKVPVLISKKTIKPGEFLSFDYAWDASDDNPKVKCKCGSKKCRGWLRK